MEVVNESLKGKEYPLYYSLIKIITTSLTLNFGGNGGLINPIFFIGTTFGNFLSILFTKIDVKIFAILGLVSFLAGTTNTPISSSLLAVELAGSSLAPYASISCIISFLITGHNSIYSSQVIAMKKIDKLEGKIGEQVKGI
ncbi:MAG: chloride channel protein [candidate division WOR-3 bacterium]